MISASVIIIQGLMMFFINDDGIRLSAVLEQPEEKTTALVIILHGFGSTKDRPHNVKAAEAMREAGFAIQIVS